jgi:DNA-binding response OmpR family regulator
VREYPVLVVEDVDDIRRRYVVGLSRAGIEADPAASLAEAVAKITRQTYSVAVVDINLQDDRSDVGDRSGHEIVRRLNANGEGTMCLIVTAQRDMESGAESFRAGMDDILLKHEIGENLTELIDKVRALRSSAVISPYGSFGDLRAYLSAPEDRAAWEYQMMSTLGLNADRFFQVLDIAFELIVPVRRRKNAAYSLKSSTEAKSITGVFWSRALGYPVEVTIGKDGGGTSGSAAPSKEQPLVSKSKFGLQVTVVRASGVSVADFEDTIGRR